MSATIYYHPSVVNSIATIRINGFDIFKDYVTRRWHVVRLDPGKDSAQHLENVDFPSYRMATAYAKRRVPLDLAGKPAAEIIRPSFQPVKRASNA